MRPPLEPSAKIFQTLTSHFIVIARPAQTAKGLFSELYSFGDSLTSYGDYGSYIQKSVLAPTALPAWSGITFSNANYGCQLGLRNLLGITTKSEEPPANLDIPNPTYLLANTYIATPGIGTAGGPSHAIGGATSSTVSLYDVITVPVSGGGQVPLSTAYPKLAKTGVQNQILAALRQGVRPDSNELTIIQAGSNDLLIASIEANPDIEGVLDQVMVNMRDNLTVQLRACGSRQLMTFALADFRGVVDGDAYQMPFLSGLLLQAKQPDAPEWVTSWASFVEAGGLEQFQTDYAAMVKELNTEFPYAKLIYFSPEFGDNWQSYGPKLGNFTSYGIDNTFGFAQSTGEQLTEDQTDNFLYFDTIHNTQSGQEMTAKAMFLTLEANRTAIEAAILVDQQVGSQRNDLLVASKQNSELVGKAGNDRLVGREGNDLLDGDRGCDVLSGGGGTDWLSGGEGSDRLCGGKGADFFSWQAKDVKSSWKDTITDFEGKKGDRLGITAILDGDNPFQNPGWNYIGNGAFTGAAAELRFQHGWLLGDVNGDGKADLNIHLLNVRSFDQHWIS